MVAPVDDLTKVHLDAGSDDPSQARAELEALLDKTKEVLAFLTHKGALVSKSAVQSIPDATWTAFTWNTEDYDTDSIHDLVTNTERLTVPSGVTKVRLAGMSGFTANGTGQRHFKITKNGGGFAGDAIFTWPTADATTIHYGPVASAIVAVTGGDYFEMEVYQNSGGALNGGWDSFFTMEIIE